MSRPVRVMVFAKAPVAGRVKTRLRGAYGAVGAARIYRRLLERTLAVAAAAAPDELELWVSPSAAHPAIRALACRHGARLRVQGGGDLGRRMHRALADAAHARRAGIIIGADCATLTPADLQRAAAWLSEGERLVIKPATDGGYLLVGGDCAPARLFQAIPWGSPRVMTQSRVRLRRLGLPWRALEAGWDVDRPADLGRLRRELGLRTVGPRRRDIGALARREGSGH